MLTTFREILAPELLACIAFINSRFLWMYFKVAQKKMLEAPKHVPANIHFD